MKGSTIQSSFIMMDIILLTIIHLSQSTTIRVNLCRKNKQRKDITVPSVKVKPKMLLKDSLTYFKDVKSTLDNERQSYEKAVGPHELIIKRMGLKDFYPTTRDTKLFKLPRKSKERVMYEIQWLLTSMVYHVKVTNVMEKDFNFSKIENKLKGLAYRWTMLMNRLGLRKRRSCSRRGFIPKLNTRREISKHSSIVLRDIHCTLSRLINILSNCRIKKKTNRKTQVIKYIFTCGKGVKSVFFNRKRRQSPKFLPNDCETPKKLYSLSQL